MKKNFYFFFFLFLLSLFSYGQKVNVLWKGKRNVVFSNNTVELPNFDNKNFDYDKNNIFISYSEVLSEPYQYTIENLVWEKMPRNQLYDIDKNAINSEEENIAGIQKNPIAPGYLLNVRVKTLKKVGQDIYRLVSYDLKKSNQYVNFGSTAALGTSDNPLKSGTFYKIRVDKSGVFKITTQLLRSMGITPSDVNPKNLRVYGNGGLMLPEVNTNPYYKTLQENAIEVVGEEDGKWDDGDYALFYAQGPNGYRVFRNGRTDNRTDRASNFQNLYSDYSYYFITFDKGEGKRINIGSAAGTASQVVRNYDDYQYINEDKTNLKNVGRLWVGDSFTKELSFNFKTTQSIPSGSDIFLRTRIIAENPKNSSVSVNTNGTVNTINANSDFYIFQSVKANGEKEINVKISPDISRNPSAVFYLDYVEATYKQPLIFNGQQMNFRNYDIQEGNGGIYQFLMDNTASADEVWNVSDVVNPKREKNNATNANEFSFDYQADSEYFANEFVAFKREAAYEPVYVERVQNQDLHSLTNTDYLIITIPEFYNEAKRLADYHERENNFKTAIVYIQQIYNEYSSGSQDITAIRNFVSHLKNDGQLKYVLLMGNGSYDYKNKDYTYSNIIPSYESEYSLNYERSYVTDDYFVMTSPQNYNSVGTILPDLPIGRILANNVTEAKTAVDKTLAYYNALPQQSNPFGDWKMNIDMVVDDDRDYGSKAFYATIDPYIKNIFETRDSNEKEYHIRKLYLGAYPAVSTAGGVRYPSINKAITDAMSSSLFVFYFGHGGVNGWAQERVLTTDNIKNFNNFNKSYSRFPLVSTITCEFTLWDNAKINSAGAMLYKLKEGGPAAMITSSRALPISYGVDFTSIFLNGILSKNNEGNFNRLGDDFLKAKIEFGASSNHLRVNFIGDPAMRLTRPLPKIVIDDIKTPVSGKIRGLDFVSVQGHIDGHNDFNGKVSLTLFNQFQDKTIPDLTYKEEGNPAVKSSAIVKDGKFNVEFYMPKDIDAKDSHMRMMVYANDNEKDFYKSDSVLVGGINPDGINDHQPPGIKLYMNNTNFVNGGITNESPTLLACLTDDTGINATGAGIGHDITLVLDGEVVNTTVLNNYFTSGQSGGCITTNLKEYQKGSVSYPFKDLKAGEHQLLLKAWDINNNSATASLNFIVRPQGEENLVIKKLLNWPNPFTDKTYIQFEHNCADALEVTVQIYTITGHLVKIIHQMVSSEPYLEGYRTGREQVEWDGTDNYGATVGKGTYIYKVFVKGQNADVCKGTATGLEKMVLLK